MQKYNYNPSSEMNRKAEIWVMRKATEKDELGQYPVVETKVATVWSAVIPQTGSLLNGRAAETVVSRTTHKIHIRFRKDITPDMWLMIDGQRYEILYILDPYLRHTTLELFCEVVYG